MISREAIHFFDPELITNNFVLYHIPQSPHLISKRELLVRQPLDQGVHLAHFWRRVQCSMRRSFVCRHEEYISGSSTAVKLVYLKGWPPSTALHRSTRALHDGRRSSSAVPRRSKPCITGLTSRNVRKYYWSSTPGWNIPASSIVFQHRLQLRRLQRRSMKSTGTASSLYCSQKIKDRRPYCSKGMHKGSWTGYEAVHKRHWSVFWIELQNLWHPWRNNKSLTYCAAICRLLEAVSCPRRHNLLPDSYYSATKLIIYFAFKALLTWHESSAPSGTQGSEMKDILPPETRRQRILRNGKADACKIDQTPSQSIWHQRLLERDNKHPSHRSAGNDPNSLEYCSVPQNSWHRAHWKYRKLRRLQPRCLQRRVSETKDFNIAYIWLKATVSWQL